MAKVFFIAVLHKKNILDIHIVHSPMTV